MLFNTVEFLIFFTIILIALVFIKNQKFQHLLLLGASYFFFYYSSNYLISLLIISTILDFYLAKSIWNTTNIAKKKILLIISLAGNLGLLGFFKYADFGIDQINQMMYTVNLEQIPYLDLVLPIGISFYTFQTISYIVDVYRGKLEPSKSLKEFALYVAFFPQLVAGPIVRASVFLPQLREKLKLFDKKPLSLISIKNHNLKFGITLISIGFFKKMFFADNIAPLANLVFSNPFDFSSFEIWAATIAFGIQIYGDFSGYSDIAIGTALILGFKLPINFNKPYFATSPADFWQRWHISLSTWLRDYLYIPLGGNKKSHSRTYVNLAAVMFLGGLWHGASWNFVVWGMLHGAYLAIHRLIITKFPILNEIKFFKSKIGKIIAILITQYFVFLAWIPFRVHDFDAMIFSMNKFILLDLQTEPIISLILANKFEFILIFVFLILHWYSYRKTNLIEKLSKLSLKKWGIFLLIVVIMIVFFYNGNPEDFIYFKF
jgi:alginate O-acetyltransferase complex protein AlgI